MEDITIENLDKQARDHIHDYEKFPIPEGKICGLCYHHTTVCFQDCIDKLNRE